VKTRIRDIAALSLFNPLGNGDAIELDGPTGGELWLVKRSAYGWYLQRDGGHIHPTIHSIDGMAEFIGAILEAAR
jgi:hypothetical protein